MTDRVVVVDDQELVRSGFAMVLGVHEDIEVVGEAATGVEALAVVRRERPDVVPMDIRMPEMDGLEATRRILDEAVGGADGGGDVRVVILTTFDPDEYVYEALRAGASAFVLKDIPPAELAAAVRTVAEGGALLAPSITSRLIGRFATRLSLDTAMAERADRLTDRERDIVRAVARGSSNAEIGDELFIGSPRSSRERADQARAARPCPDRGLRLRGGPRRGRRARHRHLTSTRAARNGDGTPAPSGT